MISDSDQSLPITALQSMWVRLTRIRIKPLRIPVYRWLIQVILFLGISLLNNAAFGYRIPMAVHIIFRSGGLVVNMILGYLTQNKRYSAQQVVSVVLVSGGIAAATASGAKKPGHGADIASATTVMSGQFSGEYFIGISMLAAALVLSTFLGFLQEKTYRKYGHHWEEGMFFLHFLALPMFSFLGRDLVQQVRIANASPQISLVASLYALIAVRVPVSSPLPPPLHPSLRTLPVWKVVLSSWLPKSLREFQFPSASSLTVPSFWLPLGLTVTTQLVCVSGVNRLTAHVPSLTVVLVLAVRKAMSLVISVILIGKGAGNAQLWCGSTAVLIGTVLYSLAPTGGARSKEAKTE
jgi:UDP-xylose/UDP-N-acetylglucosamine transporter B4